MDFTQLKSLNDWCTDYGQKQNTISVYIKNHKEEFEGHVFYDNMQGNKTYLDDVACEILSKKYNTSNSQVIANGQMYDEIKSVKQENEELKATIQEMKETMIPQLIEQVSEKMLSVALQSQQTLIQQLQPSQPSQPIAIEDKTAIDEKNLKYLKKELKIVNTHIVSVMKSSYPDVKLLDYLHYRRRVLEGRIVKIEQDKKQCKMGLLKSDDIS